MVVVELGRRCPARGLRVDRAGLGRIEDAAIERGYLRFLLEEDRCGLRARCRGRRLNRRGAHQGVELPAVGVGGLRPLGGNFSRT
jgi:hypothetical protein